jgi:predicted  nucleic acid-binding Zn-ribbon protein
VNAELEKLIALQNSDTKIRQLENSIKSAPERRVSLEQEFEKRASSIRELQRQRDDAKNTKAQIEKELADASSNLERAERNLKQAQNQKQYEAGVREKGALQKQVSDLETKLLENDETLETAENNLNERAAEIASIESEMEASFKDFEAETDQHRANLDNERKHREKIVAELPRQAASIYNRLVTRIRDGVAVAEVRNGACSSCFMALRPQMLADVRSGKTIMTCESCNRILYIAPKETASAV